MDQLLAHPKLKEIWRTRRKWALVNNLVSGSQILLRRSPDIIFRLQRKFRRDFIHWAWQKWCIAKSKIVYLFLTVIAFFKLSNEKEAEHEELLAEQTTPKCNQSHLLARLDAIYPLNGSTASTTLDDSSDSALGVAPHLPDGARRSEFPDGLMDHPHPTMESTMYSSTPIIHGGLNLRRSRLQTPHSPNRSFNRSMHSSEKSSFMAKKLFDQSDDSE